MRLLITWDAEALTWRVMETSGGRRVVASFDTLADAEAWVCEQPEEAS